MKYKIEVHSLGYEDTAKIVDAPSLRVAKQAEREAIIEWCEHNDIDIDNLEMPFTRIGKVDPQTPVSFVPNKRYLVTASFGRFQQRNIVVVESVSPRSIATANLDVVMRSPGFRGEIPFRYLTPED